MHVRIVKSGQRHASGEIDDLRGVALERHHLFVAADRDDVAVAHCGGLGPGALRIDGIDSAVDEDRVGNLGRGGLSAAAGNRENDERRTASARSRSAFLLCMIAPPLIRPPFLQEWRHAENIAWLILHKALNLPSFRPNDRRSAFHASAARSPRLTSTNRSRSSNPATLRPPKGASAARLADYPRDVNLQALLGALLIKRNRAGRGRGAASAGDRGGPDVRQAARGSGYLLVQQGHAGDAVPLLERATHLDPTLESAWFTLGKALAVLGRGADADQAFERCFALSPERRLMALAAEHHKEGRLKEAEQLYRRVLRQRPRNVDAMRLLASIALKAGRADEAEQLLERAISVAPDFLAALLDLGRLRKEQDRLCRGARVFRPRDRS